MITRCVISAWVISSGEGVFHILCFYVQFTCDFSHKSLLQEFEERHVRETDQHARSIDAYVAAGQIGADKAQENNNKSSDGNTIQNEDQMSFYVGASKSFGQKLTMEASLMEEYYHTPIWNEWNLFPTLSITYLPKAGHVIQFDLDCDRDYPTYWSVKNFTTYNVGGYGKIVGNPTLKPSRDLSLSLTYILHSRYVASLFFNNSKDEFRQLPSALHFQEILFCH